MGGGSRHWSVRPGKSNEERRLCACPRRESFREQNCVTRADLVFTAILPQAHWHHPKAVLRAFLESARGSDLQIEVDNDDV